MAEYNEGQMEVLTQAVELLKAHGLTSRDLPEAQNMERELNIWRTRFTERDTQYRELLFRILPRFYKEMAEQTSEEEAFEWVENNIFKDLEKWRDLFADAGICLKRYQIVEVTAKFKVVMPDEDSDYMWNNYVDISDMEWEDCDCETIASDLSAKDTERYNTVNSVDGLE